MVEEIITALSRIRWLFVIARNSTFTYKGQAVDVKQVARELGVRYVLEGAPAEPDRCSCDGWPPGRPPNRSLRATDDKRQPRPGRDHNADRVLSPARASRAPEGCGLSRMSPNEVVPEDRGRTRSGHEFVGLLSGGFRRLARSVR